MTQKSKKKIESKQEVQTYLDRLKYAFESGRYELKVIEKRDVDKKRPKKFSNNYTIAALFPNDDPVEAIKKELLKLTVENYIETVQDRKFSNRSEMRVFGKQFSNDEVYIKIRVELVSKLANGNSSILVMSFHYSEYKFKEGSFPYRKI